MRRDHKHGQRVGSLDRLSVQSQRLVSRQQSNRRGTGLDAPRGGTVENDPSFEPPFKSDAAFADDREGRRRAPTSLSSSELALFAVDESL